MCCNIFEHFIGYLKLENIEKLYLAVISSVSSDVLAPQGDVSLIQCLDKTGLCKAGS